MSNRPAASVSKSLTEFDPLLFPANHFISGVSINAAQISKGDLFIALPGAKTHGEKFIDQAIKNGAVAVLSDKKISSSIPCFVHENPRQLVGAIAAWLYNFPFDNLMAAGITGTNGKTTTANLVHQICSLNGVKTGLVGTLGITIGQQQKMIARTTPEADELQAIAAMMVEEKCTNLVMEVSSIAVDQNRVKGSKFEIVAFSNLTQDHLDYHKSMDLYFAAKTKLFSKEYANSALINIDDPYGVRLTKMISIPYKTVSRSDQNADWFLNSEISGGAGYQVEIFENKLKTISGKFPLLGEYNLDNLLLAVATASAMGISGSLISQILESLKPVPGRMEQVLIGQKFNALVDYAHSPDSVSRVLEAVRKFTDARVIAVLGCGGDRDVSKRAIMGRALFDGSDLSIFTSDNPRSESAEDILKQMTSGILMGNRGHVVVDRREAIDLAVSKAGPGDTVLILGKGHENGQEIQGVLTKFDDRDELAQAIKMVVKP